MSETQLDRIERTLNKFVDHVQGKLLDHDEKFERIDSRLDGIDGRLDGIDGRLDHIDGRLDNVEAELPALRREMNQRFDGLDLRLISLEREKRAS